MGREGANPIIEDVQRLPALPAPDNPLLREPTHRTLPVVKQTSSTKGTEQFASNYLGGG